MLATNEIVYPDSDGQPMADNTKQFQWITVIKTNLEWLFRDDDRVFVAGDLLWYPIEGNPKYRVAPDVMVVFGRPKGDRGSYQTARIRHRSRYAVIIHQNRVGVIHELPLPSMFDE